MLRYSVCVCLLTTPQTIASQAPLSMGILQTRILEWVSMSPSRGSSNPGIESRSPTLQVDSYHLSHQGSPRILWWVAYPSPGELPNPGIKPGSPTLQADSLPTELSGKSIMVIDSQLWVLNVQNPFICHSHCLICRVSLRICIKQEPVGRGSSFLVRVKAERNVCWPCCC